jgi:hypothetical protein
MTLPVEYQAIAETRELIKAGLRLTIIRRLTDTVGEKILRQWWWELNHTRPVSGAVPKSVGAFFEDAEIAAKAAAFVVFHKNLHGKELPLTSETLLQSWKEFNLLCGGEKLDINIAYYAIQDVRAQIVLMSRCKCCHAAYIYDESNKQTRARTNKCPYCTTPWDED